MNAPKLDGCPRCLKRDNEPKTWDEDTGQATYRCKCGHSWSTWWEHAGSGTKPELIGDLLVDFGGLIDELHGESGAPR